MLLVSVDGQTAVVSQTHHEMFRSKIHHSVMLFERGGVISLFLMYVVAIFFDSKLLGR